MSSLHDGNEVEVHLDQESTRAEVHLAPGVDPSSLDVQFVQGLLRERGVAVDRQVEERLGALTGLDAAPDGATIVVAEWTPPRHGRDGGIEWCDGFEPVADDDDDDEGDEPGGGDEAGGEEPDVSEADAAGGDEAVDFYNQCSFRTVRPGDHVATLVRATEGEDGRDVTGKTVSAKPGRRLEPKVDPESFDVDDDGRIVATITGILRFEQSTLSIERHLEIEDAVDFNTGNIDFDGTVTIGDGVKDRFVVRATGDVAVLGLVEGATLMVGGALWLRRGMAAKERGQVLVDGRADVGYMNNVRGRVRGDLDVKRELIDCELVVGGGLSAPTGAVIGGQVVVTGAAEIGTIGSGGGAPTRLVLGEVPLLGAAVARIDDLIKEWRDASRGHVAEAESLEQGAKKPGPEELARIQELRQAALECDRRIDAAERRRGGLVDAIRAASRVELIVNRRVFPKVELVIRGRTFMVTDEIRGPVRIEVDAKGVPVVTSEGRDPRPIFEYVEERNIAA